MLFGRVIGWLLLLAAAALLAHDIVAWRQGGEFAPLVLGQLWFSIDRASLNLVQAVIQRYVAAWLWDPVIETALLAWAFAVFAAAGALLLWLCRRRRDEPGRWRRRRR